MKQYFFHFKHVKRCWNGFYGQRVKRHELQLVEWSFLDVDHFGSAASVPIVWQKVTNTHGTNKSWYYGNKLGIPV